MSKGMNTTHIDKGEYNVEIELDTSAIATELADLATKIAEADAQIATTDASITSTDAELDSTRSSISALNPQITEKSQDINRKSARVDAIVDEIAAIDDEISVLEAEQTPLVALYAAISFAVNQLASQIGAIEAELVDMPPGPERDALEAELSDKQSTKEDLDAQLLSVGGEINDITNAIALLNIDKGVLEAESSTLEGEIDTLQGELDELVDQRQGLQDDIVDLEKEKSELQLEKAMLTLKKTGFQKRIDFLNDPANVPENETLDVWCADLTEDLSGDVGVIEVAGVRGNGFNVQPGYEGNAVYDSDRDGTLKPSIVVPAASAYWNWGMQGGWQKWMPTHRYGTISAIDYEADTCTVTLEAETNPDTDLDINKMASLTDVWIEYMDCNSKAFADGDEVLVEFQDNDWDSPQVIGFKDHPKGCYGYAIITSGSYVTVWDLGASAVATDVSIDDTDPVEYATFPCDVSTISDWIASLDAWTGWLALYSSTNKPTDIEDNSTNTSYYNGGGELTGAWYISGFNNQADITTTRYYGKILTALNGSEEERSYYIAHAQHVGGSRVFDMTCGNMMEGAPVTETALYTEASTGAWSYSSEGDFFSYSNSGSSARNQVCGPQVWGDGCFDFPTQLCNYYGDLPTIVTTGTSTFSSFGFGQASYYNVDSGAIVQLMAARITDNDSGTFTHVYYGYGTSDTGISNVVDTDTESAILPSTLTENTTLSASVLALIKTSENYSISVVFKER